MEQKRIKVRLTENSPYSDYGYYKKGDIGYIDGYVNGNAVIILENGKFVKADLRWIELIEQKAAWSEEDEKIYQSIMDDTVQENQLNGKQTNWLRDIKYRYFPQPKQEWKPSDEQLDSLYDVLNPCDGFNREVLESLYVQLKKLREE